ncbi:DinB family protein [Virgibacillus halophilus]|uniref:DinB family protein n=1 Tax=Tigheibacillus halophilus TaxID=361280 RepID=A0ABU5CCA3_9BACI|nr:DinB family protein [Virgibacillus halophilus]
MYRTVTDFLSDWDEAAKGTTQALQAFRDEKLDQAIVEGHNTLRWLGWHLATSPAFFAGLTGLDVEAAKQEENVPGESEKMVAAYKKIADDIHHEAEKKLTDEKMAETVEAFGQQVPRGAILRKLIDHQTHHRGQITVLLRQAGLHVPGVMGPTKEDQ